MYTSNSFLGGGAIKISSAGTDHVEPQSEIRVNQPERSEHIDVFGGGMTVLSDPFNTPSMLARQVAPPGYGVPLHVHDDDDEVFLMLKREIIVFGGAGETRVGVGVTVELPRGIPHGFRNDAATEAEFLVMLVPGRQALEMFRHFDRAVKAPTFTPAEIPAIAARYGVRFV